MNITTVCSETPFSKNMFHIETSQLTCIANPITDFYMIQVNKLNVNDVIKATFSIFFFFPFQLLIFCQQLI